MKLIFKIIYFICGLALLFIIDRYQIAGFERQLSFEVEKEAELVQLRLQDALSQRINSTGYLKALMELYPETTAEAFAEFAEKMMTFNPSIRALQIADKNTLVSYVYPPVGNEITISKPMLLIEDPVRGEYVKKAIEQKSLTLQPPFELRQGGMGIVARNPLFIDGAFSGLAIAVLDVSEILKDAFNQTDLSRFGVNIFDSNGREFFNSGTPGGEYVEKRQIKIADTSWAFSISRIGPGRRITIIQRLELNITAGVLLIFIFMIIQRLLKRTGRLADELSANEKRFLNVIENTGAGYFQIDNDGNFRDVNKSWLDMHGYQNKEEIIGKHFSVTQTKDDLASASRAVQKLRSGIGIPSGELTRLKKDGTIGYHTFTARPFYKHGELQGAEGFLFDITDRIASEKNKDFLMKEMNHRVKNNLMIISSLIKLKDNSLGDEVDLSDIAYQIDSIQLLYEKLYKSGEVSRISVKDYLEDLLNSIFSPLKNLKVDIRTEIEDVYFDVKTAVTFALIVNELSTNAIKYGFSGKEEHWIEVSLKLEKDRRQYLLKIACNGESIPDEVNLDHPETFGFRLVSTLATQLGGEISLQKRPYTKFTINFPESTSSD